MPTLTRNEVQMLQHQLGCLPERAEVLLLTFQHLNVSGDQTTDPVIRKIHQRLQENPALLAHHPDFHPALLLELLAGRVPFMTPRDLNHLSQFLGITPQETCGLLYPPGHGPGSGAFYAEFPGVFPG